MKFRHLIVYQVMKEMRYIYHFEDLACNQRDQSSKPAGQVPEARKEMACLPLDVPSAPRLDTVIAVDTDYYKLVLVADEYKLALVDVDQGKLVLVADDNIK